MGMNRISRLLPAFSQAFLGTTVVDVPTTKDLSVGLGISLVELLFNSALTGPFLPSPQFPFLLRKGPPCCYTTGQREPIFSFHSYHSVPVQKKNVLQPYFSEKSSLPKLT